MTFPEVLDRHWLVASFLFMAALWVLVACVGAWARKQRAVTVVVEGDESGVAQAEEAMRAAADELAARRKGKPS